MPHTTRGFASKLVASPVSIALAASAQAGLLGIELGGSSKDNHGNLVPGSAGPSGNQGESAQLEKLMQGAILLKRD